MWLSHLFGYQCLLYIAFCSKLAINEPEDRITKSSVSVSGNLLGYDGLKSMLTAIPSLLQSVKITNYNSNGIEWRMFDLDCCGKLEELHLDSFDKYEGSEHVIGLLSVLKNSCGEKMKKISIVDMNGTVLKASMRTILTGFPNLESFSIVSSHVHHINLDGLEHIPLKLRELDLPHNWMAYQPLDWLWKLNADLEILRIGHWQGGINAPIYIGNREADMIATKFPNLTELSITRHGIDPEGVLSIVNGCKKLKRLSFIDGLIGKDVADIIASNLFNLEALTLNGKIGDEGMGSVISKCTQLKHLHAFGCNLSKLSIEMIVENCENLETLDLSLNGFTIEETFVIQSNCKNLKSFKCDRFEFVKK